MFSNSSGLTASDVLALGNNNDGFGGIGGWWVIIIFALIFGWGNGGGIFGGSRNGSATDGYILTSDFANIERKIDGVNNGLCEGFYTQAQLVNGVNQNLANGFASAELARANNQAAIMAQMNNNAVAQMQSDFGIQSAISSCCCENRQAIANLNYNLATQSCATNTAINQATQSIIQNDNANYRALHDEIVANKMEAKDTRIAELSSQISALQLAASQAAQNTYLVNQLRPAPIPAYPVSAPYYYGGFGTTIA